MIGNWIEDINEAEATWRGCHWLSFFLKNLKLFSQQLNWILQQLKMVNFGILTMFTAFKLSVFCRLLLQGVTRMNMDCKLKHLGRRFKVVTAMPTKIIKLG